ncbi:MAG: HlyC/CorC family transporter [Rhodothermales bacterium]|nr:HlyC/CorC family transporter [Rhodothermales bacterium]
MIIALIVITLFLSAFFSSSEIAFVAANRLRVEMRSRDYGFIGRITSHFVGNPTTMLTTTLVGNNLSLVIYSTAAAYFLEPPLEHFFSSVVGFETATTGLSVLIGQTTIASIVVLLFGEIIPKSYVREIANRAVFYLALPLRVAYYVLLPLTSIAHGFSSALMRVFRTERSEFQLLLRKDFELLIEEGVDRGALELDEDEQTLLTNMFAMDSMIIKESMVPRTDVVALEDTGTIEEARKKFMESGFSKLPVYHENIDDIVGVAFAQDLFKSPKSLSDMMRQPAFVPDSRPSKELLTELLNRNQSIAIVLDEYGGMAGIITLEDLLEELFGDIQDEFDTDEDIMRQLGADVFLLSGRVELDMLEERFNLVLPEGDYETVAGFILENLGQIPSPQESFQIANYEVTVIRSSASRIDLVRLTRKDAPSTAAPESV